MPVCRWRAGFHAGRVMKFVLAVYIAAVALLPFSHHDLACHLKSTTHCLSCVVGASGETAQVAAGALGAGLTVCGQLISSSTPAHDTRHAGILTGRSPPARG